MEPAGKPTALVIDDNRQNADLLCRMLDYLGVNGKAAYGPRAAMLVLNQLIPDIIFMDINMPGVDGFEVLAYLRRYPQLSEIPIVFITSDDQAETARKVRKTGALQMIIKPASIELVEKALQTAGLLKPGLGSSRN
jgi:CheY-like chemotaxis protein